MTKNQLEYLGLEETKRNNVVVAEETNRHNKAVEFETHRSNVTNEQETNRHNLVGEGISQGTLDETKRHNIATEKQTSKELSENRRHNKVTEKEAGRHNKVTEKNQIKSEKIRSDTAKSTAKTAADASKTSASIGASASRYATDSKKEMQAKQQEWQAIQNQKDRFQKQWEITRNNKNAKSIAKLNAETSKLINKLKLAQEKHLTNRKIDAQIKKIDNEWKKAKMDNDMRKWELVHKYVDTATKLGTDWLKAIGEIIPL